MSRTLLNIAFMFLSVLFVASSCEREISLTQPEEIPKTATVLFYSNPEGAEIIVNGRKSGYKTPDSLTWLDPGTYEFTLSLQYYRDTSLTRILKEDQRDTIYVDYLANPLMYGSIKFTTVPDSAKIYLNSIFTGKRTPAVMDYLVPGIYNVTFEKKEHRSRTIQTIVTSRQTADAFAELTDTSVWVDYNLGTSPIPTNNTTYIYADMNNIIWIGTNGFGVVAFDGNEMKIYNSVNSALPNNTINVIRGDSNGRLWIGTNGGLSVLDNFNFINYNVSNSDLPNDIIEDVQIASTGDGIYVATQNGLAYLHNNIFTIYNSGNSLLKENWIKCLAADENGYLWLGSASTGIYRMRKDEWQNFNSLNSDLPNDNITALEWSHGKLYVGYSNDNTSTAGVSVFDGNSWNSDFFNFSAGTVSNIFSDEQNNIWVATDSGIYFYASNGASKIYRSSNTGMRTNHIESVAQDKTGIYWVATKDNGFYKFKKK